MQTHQSQKSLATAYGAASEAAKGRTVNIVCATREARKRSEDMLTQVLSETKFNYVATSDAFYLEGAGQINLKVM